MPEDTGDDAGVAAGGALRAVVDHRRLIGLDLRLLAVVAVLAAAAGVVQAGVLLVVVRAATALTAETELVSGSVGPFSASDLTVGQLIWLATALLAVLFVLDTANSWGQAALHARSQRRTRRAMLEAYTAATYDVQAAHPRGETQQLLLALPNQVASVAGALGSGVSAGLTFVMLTGSALVLSPVAALTVVVGMVLMLAILRPLLAASRVAGDRHTTDQRALGAETAELLELSGEIQAFGVGDAASERNRERIDVVARRLQRLRFLGRMSSVAYRVGALAMVLAMLALVDAADATNLAALAGAMLMLLRSLSYGQAAQTAYQSINETVPVIRQLVEERDRLAAGSVVPSAGRGPERFGELRLDEVSFTYPGGAGPVVVRLDLVVEPGDFMAVVGPSGSGKSTIMSLLLGLRSPTSGVISLDGVDLADVDDDWWHRHVAFVPQESRLQSGTIRDAIRFHRPWVSDDAIEAAAELAGISTDIESWPERYETQVGQSGDQLSGGQRQRVALARAMAGGPRLLLLDEPTSALDAASEGLIRRALESIRGDTTIVAIAHRPETVRNASRIVRVEAGRVFEFVGGVEDALRSVE